MTDSQDNFKQVKLYFAELLHQSKHEQQKQISELQKLNKLNKGQINLLKDMLCADDGTQLATDINDISDGVLNNASNLKEETLTTNQQIGPYKIIKPIGTGGMGHVYLAQRNDGEFEQQVALKLPHLNFNPALKKRFENERQILAQLTHENIAHLLDGGTTQNEQPYLVMEYIEGQSIDLYCKNKIPNLKQRISLIKQVCSAVSFSHQRLVLHRDLKPSNIMVTDNGTVKLLDFGIAKLTDLDEENLAEKTATQIMTRNYASPEQIQGNPVSTHSDLFSLAIISYELITGYHPYKHSNQVEREQNLITGNVMRVSQRSDKVRSLFPELTKISNKRIQGDLENILLKALSLDPQNRYSSVQDFSDDLTRFIANRPVKARKPNRLYYISKLIQRHKTAAASILMTTLILIGATVYSINKAKIAEVERQKAVIEAQKSEKIAQIMQEMFQRAQPAEGASEVLARDLLDQGIQQLKADKKIDYDAKYNLMVIIFRSYAFLGKIDSMKNAMQGVYSDCVADSGKYNKYCQNVLIYKAYLQHRLGRDDLAVDIYQQAEDIALSETPVNKKMYIKILRNAYGPLYNTGNIDLANLKTQQALEMYKKLPDPDPAEINAALNNLAIAAIANSQFEMAKKTIEEIKPNYIQGQLEHASDMTRYHDLYSMYYSKQHKIDQSLAHIEKSLAINKILYTEKYPNEGIILLRYAYQLFRAGRINDSIIAFKNVDDYYTDYGDGQVIKQLSIKTKLAMVYSIIGDYTQAKYYMDQAISIGLEKYSQSDIDQCELKKSQVSVSMNQSSDIFKQKLDILKECITVESANTLEAEIYWNYFNIHYALKQNDKVSADNSKQFLNDFWAQYPDDHVALKKQLEEIK